MAYDLMGVAALSIDVTAPGVSGRGSLSQDATLGRLLALMDEFQVPATWAVAEPADCEATAHILSAHVSHEIAILGDAGWIGEAAGRPAFACNLARRIITAQAAGLAIQVLACRSACVPRTEYDLLVKHNMAVVRQPRRTAGRAIAELQPQPLRHGIWELPSTVEIPQANSWWGAGARAAKNSIARAAAMRGVAHVAIDLASLAACDSRLRAAGAVLQAIAEGCNRGMIQSTTLGELGDRLSRPIQVASARSILRAA
jgi:hypothetical protein